MPRRYTSHKLKYEAAQVKRHLLNEVRRGRLTDLYKKDAYCLLARRLGLRSSRTLFDGSTKEYLDEWYQRVVADARGLQQSKGMPLDQLREISEFKKRIGALDQEVQRQVQINREYKRALDTVRVENEDLRARLLPKRGPIQV